MYLPKRKVANTVCPLCKGDGKVKIKENNTEKIIPCPRCQGTGYI